MVQQYLKNMNKEYDVIIIGAGIGGLVCGNYLAKTGMKVLIIEQHQKVGGYCTSFERKGFTFDVAAHSLGSCREDGRIGIIFKDLNLHKKVEITRAEISDLIITPDYKIAFKSDINETISDLQENFPHQEKEIKAFFKFIKDSSYASLYLRLRNKTFEDVLNEYFEDTRLKTILSVVLGNIGLPPSKASAFSSVVLYREHILDGGYYPKGGMQAFSDALAENFREYGGEIYLSRLAKKIKIKNKKVEGLVIEDGSFIRSKYVVSNCDATQTFFNLIGERSLKGDFVERLKKMTPSPSVFMVYLGINKKLKTNLERCCSLWYLPQYDIEKAYLNTFQKETKHLNESVISTFPSIFSSFHDSNLAPFNSESIRLGINMSHSDDEWYDNVRFDLAEWVIKIIENIIPNLSSYITIKEIATPSTLYKYTLNTHGAMYGWASTLFQANNSMLPSSTFFDNLFLTGHWTTQLAGQGGISSVAYSGYTVAHSILLREKNNKVSPQIKRFD